VAAAGATGPRRQAHPFLGQALVAFSLKRSCSAYRFREGRGQ